MISVAMDPGDLHRRKRSRGPALPAEKLTERSNAPTTSDAARLLGQSKSDAKAAAARENGALGGRPRKVSVKPEGMPPIVSVDRLAELARERRAVWFHGWNGSKSAAFVIGMPLKSVLEFLNRGLFEYPAKTATRKLLSTRNRKNIEPQGSQLPSGPNGPPKEKP